MKKGILFTIAAMMLFGMASAQEKQNNRLRLGVDFGSGMTVFCNHSSISLFQDPTIAYLAQFNYGLAVGACIDDDFLGLEFSGDAVVTSAQAVNETMEMLKLAAMIRHYAPVNNNVKFSAGLKVGPYLMGNGIFYVNGQDEKIEKDYYRWGLCVEPEFGVYYRFIGITIAPFMGLNFHKDTPLPEDLPADLVPSNAGTFKNSWESYGGFKVMLHAILD
ncbi:MAG: hypothetical protein J6P83_04605 [Bacteroidales bacterium]|nr:hypothetical protein [Bacteroidales bacterium]